jgi:glycosyltransferase involved in cell wall biosynthesis
VLFLARLARYKGYMALMRAAPQVWRQFPDVTFVFAGPHNLRSAITFMSVHDRRIRSIGAADQKTKTAALAGCELLCVPSTQESFGMVFVEAWSLGKPVIGGRIGPVATVIEDGKDGRYTWPRLAEQTLGVYRSVL